MKQRRPDGRLRHARTPRRNPSPKTKGGKIRHRGFSRRKNNKCRNPSHACTPRKNPSPPLRPVTSACAHVPTDQRPIWSDLRFLKVSFRYVFIICLTPTSALPEIFVASKGCMQKHHYHLQTHAGKQEILHTCYNSCCLTSTDTQSRNCCSSSALLALTQELSIRWSTH